MNASRPPRCLLVSIALLLLLAALAPRLAAADHSLHPAPPAAAISPLYEGRSDPAVLAPLRAWVRQRCADGTCSLEQLQQELQTALNALHERTRQGIHVVMDDIKSARTAREALVRELAAAKAQARPPVGLAEKLAKLPPIPARVWGDPHVEERASGQPPARRAPTVAASAPTLPPGDIDLDGAAERLKSELAALSVLAEEAQRELQAAAVRLQQATAALGPQARAMHEAAMASIRNTKG